MTQKLTTPDRIRTCDLSFRKAPLYPTELRGRSRRLPQVYRARRGETRPERTAAAAPPRIHGRDPTSGPYAAATPGFVAR